MINIYQKPTKDNPTLGFTFLHFSSEGFGNDYRKHDHLNHAIQYLRESSVDVILFNLETFHLFAEKTLSPMDQVQEESQKALRELIVKWGNKKHKYKELLADVIKNANFMRALVKPMPTKQRGAGIMMAGTILAYCKAELDECEKDKDKD